MPARRRADDPEDLDPAKYRRFHGLTEDDVTQMVKKAIHEAGNAANGIQIGYKGAKASISGSPATLQVLIVLLMGAALGALVYFSKISGDAIAGSLAQSFRDSRLEDRRRSHEHLTMNYEAARTRCVLLLDAARRDRANEQLNIGGDPLRVYCPWLGEPPQAPTYP